MLNQKIKAYTESVEGKVMFCIVREFLEFFDLDFTISVYEPESYLGTRYKYNGKVGTIKDLGLKQLEENCEGPLLLQLIRLVQSNNNTIPRDSCESDSKRSSAADSDDNTKTEMLLTNNERSVSVSEEYSCKPDNLDATFDVSNPKVMLYMKDKKTDVQEKEERIVNGHNLDESEHINENKIEAEGSPGKELSKSNVSIVDLTGSLDKSDHNKESENEAEGSPGNELSESNISLVDLTGSPDDSKLSSKMDISGEKLKLSSQKSPKSKSNLSSLIDLPPLQITKNRSNDPMILPSLFSREFKEKTNLKELDELLDLDPLDNYEEDFMSGSEIELSAKKSPRGENIAISAASEDNSGVSENSEHS